MNSTLDFLIHHFNTDKGSERERPNAVVSAHSFLIVAMSVYLTRRNLNYFCVSHTLGRCSVKIDDFGLATSYSIWALLLISNVKFYSPSWSGKVTVVALWTLRTSPANCPSTAATQPFPFLQDMALRCRKPSQDTGPGRSSRKKHSSKPR